MPVHRCKQRLPLGFGKLIHSKETGVLAREQYACVRTLGARQGPGKP